MHSICLQSKKYIPLEKKKKFLSWNFFYMLLIKGKSVGIACLAQVKKKK